QSLVNQAGLILGELVNLLRGHSWSSGARELGLYPQTVIPRPLESVLPSDIVSPSRRLAQPETRVGPDISLPVPSSEVANSPHDGADGATFSPHISMHVDPASTVHTASVEPLLSSLLSTDQSIPFDDLIRMMEEPLPLTNQGALQEITAAAEPTAAETTSFLFVEATLDQGNPLSALSSIALNEERNEPPTASHSVLDPSMPPEEIGIFVVPLSQPAGSAATGQGDASPIPGPNETNNTEGGLFVPLPQHQTFQWLLGK
ncbi:hypothetical protein Taro_038542, partial [Colocasia esculenta]|nr:hypothetical protein [Colocasia esculenta]